MAITDDLKQQHRAAALLSARLRDLVDQFRGDQDAFRVTLQLARLHSLLRLHLIEEDYALYPALLGSGDGHVVALARQTQAATGLLAEALEHFMVRWSSSALIGNDFAAFRDELLSVLDALDDRIAREENELYPLVDAIGDAFAGRRAA